MLKVRKSFDVHFSKKSVFANQWFFLSLDKKQTAETMFSPIFEKQIFEIQKFSKSENQLFEGQFSHKKVCIRKSMISHVLRTKKQNTELMFSPIFEKQFFEVRKF